MAFNLKNRHLLSLAHHSTEEIKFLVGLAADLKEAKYCGTEQPLLKGEEHCPHFREGVDSYPLCLRGGGSRPGCSRDLLGAQRISHWPQGVHEGHGPRPGAYV